MNKQDFTVVLRVENANPNGDPQADNRPRQYDNNHGYMTPVCIKHKIRVAMDKIFGKRILIKTKEDCIDDKEAASIQERIKIFCGECPTSFEPDFIEKVENTFIDVRMFGAVFADKNSSHKRASISITPAVSASAITIDETQITKCISLQKSDKKGSDTMGMMYSVPYGLYVFHGSINPLIAKKTGLTSTDIEVFKKALVSMFTCDASEARPEGSITIELLVWNEHSCQIGDYPPQKTQNIVKITPLNNNPASIDDYEINIEPLDELNTTIMWNPFYHETKDKIICDNQHLQ